MSITAQELENFLAAYRKEIRKSAFELLKEDLPLLRPEDFDLYEKNGNRLIYEAAYFSRRKFLAVLGMEAVVETEETGRVDAAVLSGLCAVLEEICGEETWALPAHVSRHGNPAWRETVDLFASETAQTLSELSDRLQLFLPENIKDTMEREVNRRVLKPYFLSEPPYAFWEVGSSNWAAVCAGGIGSACIHLANAGRRLIKPLSDCLDRVGAVFPCYFQSFTDDGACMEGLQYYTYGMTYFSNFAWELYELNGENLFHRPDIAAFAAKCIFQDGVSLSFSDSSKDDTFRVGLQALQALMYGAANDLPAQENTDALTGRGQTFFPPMERAAHLHSDPCYRFAGLKLDWFATKAYLEEESRAKKAGRETIRASAALKQKDLPVGENEEKPEPSYCFHILPSAQWCVGYAKNGAGFACKGGHNGEPHNHNDVGHLIYEADGVLFLTDLGAGEYTKDYFSERRYQILCNHSFGHSVPILNGQGQRAGVCYRCTAFLASVEEKAGTEERKRGPAGAAAVRMEIGGAYSLSADGTPQDGKSIRREMRFDLETGELTVTDRFAFQDDALDIKASENLVTQIPPIIEGSRIWLNQNGAQALIEVCKPPGMPSPQISVVTYDHRNHQGAVEKVYGIRWEVPLRDGEGVSCFTVRRTVT